MSGSPLDCAPRYAKAMERGDLAGALAAVVKGVGDPSLMTRMPAFVLSPLFRVMIRADAPDDRPSLTELIPTLQQDLIVAREMAGTIERYRALRAEVPLPGGDRSKPYLATSLDALESVLPCVARKTARRRPSRPRRRWRAGARGGGTHAVFRRRIG